MGGSLDLKLAERCGSQVAADFGFDCLPVDPRVIASKRGIVVDVKPLESCWGCLLKHGDNFGIMYSTKLIAPGAANFTIAHELGHYFLEGHADALFPNGSGRHESNAPFGSSDPREREADAFAVGLLLPEDHFIAAAAKHPIGWDAIEALANLCNTSLTATAIRYAELASVPVAVISATKTKVDRCAMSDALKSWRGMTCLSKGQTMPVNTASHELITQSAGKKGRFRKEDISDFENWFTGGPAVECQEQVVVFGDYGTSLTLLWADASLDPADSDDVDDDF